MARISAALAMLLAMTTIALGADAPRPEPVIIGDATMMKDGTIVMNLWRTADGTPVNGNFKYGVSDPQYADVLHHLGAMKPGETKLVPAWDDDPKPK
jgi:hypothetical protein